jgi:hypothetical protein
VRLVTVSSLRTGGPVTLYGPASALRPKVARVCLIEYSGKYHATKVTDPLGRGSGRLAVVAVTYPGKHLVGTLILDRSPFPFSHTHIAGF